MCYHLNRSLYRGVVHFQLENVNLIIIKAYVDILDKHRRLICLFSEHRLQIFASPGGNVSLPCHLNRTDGSSFAGIRNRIKWTKLEDINDETDVVVSMGFHKITYGRFQNHVYLQEADENDATLIITNLKLDHFGTYKCEIINWLDDIIVEVELRMGGN